MAIQFCHRFFPPVFVLLVVGYAFATITILFYQNALLNNHENNTKTLNSSYFHHPLDILYVEKNLNSLNQTDPQLIQYARVKYLTPPSKQPYNLGERKAGSTPDEFSNWVAKFFDFKRNGVFIEVGAKDGVKGSHTLYLEKELGWRGLLVECNPTVVPFLRARHRKAWIADICFSPTPHAGLLNISTPAIWTSSTGTNIDELDSSENSTDSTEITVFEVQSIPLYTILAALEWKEVDYFSFNVEGQELAILKNFPLDLIRFKVLTIETQFYTKEERIELDYLLKGNGYVFLKYMETEPTTALYLSTYRKVKQNSTFDNHYFCKKQILALYAPGKWDDHADSHIAPNHALILNGFFCDGFIFYCESETVGLHSSVN